MDVDIGKTRSQDKIGVDSKAWMRFCAHLGSESKAMAYNYVPFWGQVRRSRGWGFNFKLICCMYIDIDNANH